VKALNVKILYVTDRAAIGPERFRAILERLAGLEGLSVQLRERSVPDSEVLVEARRARDTLGPHVPLFVNRRFDLALAAEASGVHLPASGLPLHAVRRHAPRGFSIGVSTHSAAEACEAIASGADVVVLGPIFSTPSKERFGAPLGAEALAGLPPLREHGAEVYAIGGIDVDRLDALEPYRDRFSGVAAIRMFQQATDPRAAAAGVIGR
jgi:thiamine-phosphate pyrophosphorylase